MSTKKLIKYLKIKKNDIDFINVNNEKISEDVKISNYFNQYFSTIGNVLANKIKIPDNHFNLERTKRNENSIFLLPTESHEIKKIIKSLKNKIGGADKIHARVLKHIVDYIAEPIAYIINLSMSKAVYPDHFKVAEIIPIYKTKDKHNLENYRPISLISNLAKVFEKILHNRLLDFFVKHNIISEKQYGFVRNKGTKDAIANLTDYIYKNLDSDNCTTAVMLDFSKAFDTVQHNILLNKLELYGVRGKPLKLIKNYITNRYQYVKLNGKKSNMCELKIGVPQGTIMGPLFFIIYINEMLNLIPNILSYADDTVILCAEKTWVKTQETMQKYLLIINFWLSINKLSLNVKKTEYLTFSIRCDKLPNNFELNIGNTRLNNVENYKYLGIYIDQHMRWDFHINQIVKKLRYLLFVFYKLKYILNENALMSIYYGLFHSIATYGIIAWGNSCKTVIEKIYKMQNRVLKIRINNNRINVSKKTTNY